MVRMCVAKEMCDAGLHEISSPGKAAKFFRKRKRKDVPTAVICDMSL